MPSYHDIQQFLFFEARLMDEHRYDDWLALWAEQAHYFIPAGDDERGINYSIALVNEERPGIEDRIKRLKGGAHYAQDPKSQMSRVVSNVEILEENEGELLVTSTFNLTAYRKSVLDVIAGRTTHRLKLNGAEFRIAAKKVQLATSRGVMTNLTFLV